MTVARSCLELKSKKVPFVSSVQYDVSHLLNLLLQTSFLQLSTWISDILRQYSTINHPHHLHHPTVKVFIVFQIIYKQKPSLTMLYDLLHRLIHENVVNVVAHPTCMDLH